MTVRITSSVDRHDLPRPTTDLDRARALPGFRARRAYGRTGNSKIGRISRRPAPGEFR